MRPDHLIAIKMAAKSDGMLYTAWMRQLVLDAAGVSRRGQEGERKEGQRQGNGHADERPRQRL